MCLNKRVLVGLGVAAVAALAIAPRTLPTLAPLLVLALCPLSMILMMRGMGGMNRAEQAGRGGPADEPGGASGSVAGVPATDVWGAGGPAVRFREYEAEIERLRAQLSGKQARESA